MMRKSTARKGNYGEQPENTSRRLPRLGQPGPRAAALSLTALAVVWSIEAIGVGVSLRGKSLGRRVVEESYERVRFPCQVRIWG